MNLEQWVKYSGELPTANSILFIIMFSIVFGYIAQSVFGSFWITLSVGSAFGLSGFFLVVLPNILFIRKMLKDEQQKNGDVK